jgi:hypothetical protein
MSAACETVIAKLASDEEFRAGFEADRAAALAGLELTGDERRDLFALDVSIFSGTQPRRRVASTVCAMKGGLGS